MPLKEKMPLNKFRWYSTFPTAQFSFDGFCRPYWHVRCSCGRGILLQVGENISSRLLTDHKVQDGDECFFFVVEIYIPKNK